jgi:phosphate transport system permease protein
VFHHVLPLAAPGILTGTIIGLAQALGETAPLLLIGMVAFIAIPDAPARASSTPNGAAGADLQLGSAPTRPSWSERASGAIIVLLVFLMIMNAHRHHPAPALRAPLVSRPHGG